MSRSLPALAGLLLLAGCAPADAPTSPPSAPASPAVAIVAPAGVTRIDLGTLGGPSSYTTDLNDAGVVVGWSELPDHSRRAFRWTRGSGMQPLPLLAGFTESQAISITPRGDILGRMWSGTGDPGADVVWRAAGGILRLNIPRLPDSQGSFAGDRNDSGEVIGSAFTRGWPHAWIWSQQEGIHDITTDIPNGIEVYAVNINRHGLVAGINNDCNSGCNYRAFLWSRRHGYRPLGLVGELPYRETQGLGSVDDRGTVVGWVDTRSNTTPVPFVWRAGSGFRLLPGLLPSFTWGYAMAINPGGTVVGASLGREAQFSIQAAAWPRGGGIINLNGADPNPSVALAINRMGLAAGWSALQPQGGLNHATAWIIAPTATGALPDTAGGERAQPVGSPRLATSGVAGCLVKVARLPSRAALLDCVLALTR